MISQAGGCRLLGEKFSLEFGVSTLNRNNIIIIVLEIKNKHYWYILYFLPTEDIHQLIKIHPLQ